MRKGKFLLVLFIIIAGCKKDSSTGNVVPKGWSQLGGSFNLSYKNEGVYAIAVDNADNVYICQDYDPAGQWTPLKFDGTKWAKLGTLNSSDIVEHPQIQLDQNNNVYISVEEAATISNSTNLTFVTKFDGNSWKMVGPDNDGSISGVSGAIPFSVTPSGNIYASFLTPRSAGYRNVKWDGTSWSSIPDKYSDPVSGQTVTVDMHYGFFADASGNIYTGGVQDNGTRNLSKYDGSTWQNLGFPFNADQLTRISSGTFDQNGNLYIATFLNSAGTGVYKRTGDTWSAAGTQPEGSITTMVAAPNGHVYAGGSLVNASGKYYVAEWDGSAWSELGGPNSSGLNGYIWALALNSHGDLYVGGQFTNANGDAYVAVYKEQ